MTYQIPLLPLNLRGWANARDIPSLPSSLSPTPPLCLRWIQNLCDCQEHATLPPTPTPFWLRAPSTIHGWLYREKPTVLSISCPLLDVHPFIPNLTYKEAARTILPTLPNDIQAALPRSGKFSRRTTPFLALRSNLTTRQLLLKIEIWNLSNLPPGPYAATTKKTAIIFTNFSAPPSLPPHQDLY